MNESVLVVFFIGAIIMWGLFIRSARKNYKKTIIDWGMGRTAGMSYKERIKIYKRLPKKELAEMIVQWQDWFDETYKIVKEQKEQ